MSASASEADPLGEGRSSPGEEKEERASGSNIADDQAKVGDPDGCTYNIL